MLYLNINIIYDSPLSKPTEIWLEMGMQVGLFWFRLINYMNCAHLICFGLTA